MKMILQIIKDTPWKLFNEVLMYLVQPFVFVYLRINRVEIGKGAKFYGFPRIYRHRNSSIIIGDDFECRSWWFSNPLGINHPTIISTWRKGAKIVIGNDVGISGGSLVASSGINIGDKVLIGANSTIVDSNFHPLKGENRRYSKKNIKEKPVQIGNSVFIGMNSTILKGVKIKDGSTIPAGAVIRD